MLTILKKKKFPEKISNEKFGFPNTVTGMTGLPRAGRGSRPRTSWCTRGAAGRTQCRSGTGSGSLGTEIEKQC